MEEVKKTRCAVVLDEPTKRRLKQIGGGVEQHGSLSKAIRMAINRMIDRADRGKEVLAE